MNLFDELASKNNAEPFDFVGEVEIEDNSTGGNIFERLSTKAKSKPQDNFGFLDTAKDVGQQVVKQGVSGALGSYGNLFDATGLQLKQGQFTPGQEAQLSEENNILDRLNKGEQVSTADLMSLSEDNSLGSRLPTSNDVNKGIEAITGIGEAKTPAGRIAGRGSQFLGEGLATGGGSGKVLGSLAASGALGQTIRETDGPEALATGVEIAGPLASSAISGKLLPSSKQKDLVDAGRQIGLTEKQIAPLIQSEGKTAIVSPFARKGSSTKKLFGSIKESLGDSYQNVKSSVSSLPQVDPRNAHILESKFIDIATDLRKTLKPSPDKEAAINFIEDAARKVRNSGATPEELINFWQDINKSVNWNSLQGGKKSLARLKEPVLEVLKNVAPNAAKDFELTNQLYSKYAQISKKLKPDIVDSFVNKGEIIAGVPAALSLVMGNPIPLATVGTEVGVRLLAREMLTNPYFQNVGNKLVKNFNSGSLKSVQSTMKQVREYMDRKHPNEDWSFLNEEISLPN